MAKINELTRDEILAMEPGRELDKLVNEKLFSYSVRSHLVYEEGMNIDRTDFLPSTYLPNAWEVVEKMKETWSFTMLNWGGDAPYEVIWGYQEGEYRYTAQSAEEAICKAALLAVMDL
jgi:Phage ABA sandwich domain